ncbi:hypothetical protein [Bosea sp. (in: a-proteobacteria)]|nr:hypothetical protein [Bosea sp. (in: a-proteobacteria)]
MDLIARFILRLGTFLVPPAEPALKPVPVPARTRPRLPDAPR